MSTQANQHTSANHSRPRPRNGNRDRNLGEEVNGNGRRRQREDWGGSDPDMTGHLGVLGADLIQLGQLQLELLAVDTRDAAEEARTPTLLSCLAIGFLVGSCPLALLGLSWWLTEVTALSLAASSLTVALVGLVLAVGLFFAAWRGFKTSFALLNRSRSELHSNLEWIKKILTEKHRHQNWPA